MTANDAAIASASPESAAPRVWRDRDFLRTYVGPNWAEYVGVLDEMKGSGLPAAWSWSIFFIPMIWLVYRKRYVWAVGLLVCWTVLKDVLGGPWTFAVVLMHLFFATFGKAIYVRSALADIERIKSRVHDHHGRVLEMQRKGGVSDKAVMIVLMLLFFAWLFLSFARW
jgi:hypothetical protein